MHLPSHIMQNKTVLITGGTGGIGKETARQLAQLGAQVVIVGRNEQRGNTAINDLIATTGNQNIHLLRADLSSQAEIRRVAGEFQQKFGHLHVLINNVAGIYRHRTETVDGIEATLALGHLAPFLLTHLLLPMLEKSAPARIINVSSDGHSMAKMDFDDMQAKKFYRAVDIYTRVKLMNLLFTYELARRLDGTGITVNAVDPGPTDTQLTATTTSDMLPPIMRLLWPFLSRFGFDSPAKAARSSVYATASPDLEHVTGTYISTKLEQAKSSKASYNTQAQRRLWTLSQGLTGILTDDKLAV